MKKLLVILVLFLNFSSQALSRELSCKDNPKCKNFPKVTKIQGIKYPLTMVQKQKGEKPTGDDYYIFHFKSNLCLINNNIYIILIIQLY